MIFDIKKSDNFMGLTGWGFVFNKILDPIPGSGDSKNISLLLCGGSESIAENKADQLEKYFNDRAEVFFGNDSQEPGEGLKKLIKSFLDRFALRGEKISIAALFALEDEISICSNGEILGYLFRDGNYIKLFSESDEFTTVKGKLKLHDIFIISSVTFFKANLEKIVSAGMRSKRDPMYYSQKKLETFDVKQNEGITEKPTDILKSTLANSSITGNIYAGSIQDILKRTSNTTYIYLQTKPSNIEKENLVSVNKGDFSEKVDLSQRFDLNRENYLEKLHKLLNSFRPKGSFVGGEEYEKTSKRRKTAVFVGVILLIALAVSISLGINKQKKEDIKKSYVNDLTTSRHNIDEALNIFTINPGRSREIFSQGRKLAEGLSQKGIEDPDLKKLKADISENQGRILGEYKEDAENFIDLGLITDNFHGDKILLSDSDVYIIDKTARKIVKIVLTTKRSEVTLGPNKISEIYDTSVTGDKVYVVNSEGIFEVSGAKKAVFDEQHENNVLLASFANNLYLLGKNDSRITRYAGNGSSFSGGKDWLSSSISQNFSNAKDLQIDGSVWILTDDGKLNKFVQGEKRNFELQNNITGNLNISNFFVNDENTGIYLLDKDQGRIYVFTKDGTYIAQYISDSIKDTSRIVVSEKNKKIILLKNDKLFSMEIKHLE
jgi:hypothetical protein